MNTPRRAATASGSTIGDVADLVRSKNAGPFWQTLDIFCGDDARYERIAAVGVITVERVAQLYRVDPDSVKIFRMPNIRVVKVSFPRRITSGSAHDRDVHAGQQHVLLAGLSLTDDPQELT
jgi:hypothetical protein